MKIYHGLLMLLQKHLCGGFLLKKYPWASSKVYLVADVSKGINSVVKKDNLLSGAIALSYLIASRLTQRDKNERRSIAKNQTTSAFHP